MVKHDDFIIKTSAWQLFFKNPEFVPGSVLKWFLKKRFSSYISFLSHRLPGSARSPPRTPPGWHFPGDPAVFLHIFADDSCSHCPLHGHTGIFAHQTPICITDREARSAVSYPQYPAYRYSMVTSCSLVIFHVGPNSPVSTKPVTTPDRTAQVTASAYQSDGEISGKPEFLSFSGSPLIRWRDQGKLRPAQILIRSERAVGHAGHDPAVIHKGHIIVIPLAAVPDQETADPLRCQPLSGPLHS